MMMKWSDRARQQQSAQGQAMERTETLGWMKALKLGLVVLAATVVTGHGPVLAQTVLDICGCAGDPTLQPFNAGNPATYPPGTSGCSSPCTSGTITLQIPADGILKFSSFTVDGGFNVQFSRNAANTPVTILVSGDVLLRGAFGCCQSFSVSGSDGSSGGSQTIGFGGLGGPGGFRGGDGAAPVVNGAAIGGTGFGPGGGSGATQAAISTGGTFFGVPELLPLVGGSGGGGGTGIGSSSSSCTGGGGGGGGGALLIAANGTFAMQNMQVFADGGSGGSVGNGACARGGSGGSGGAIRVVASRLTDGGNANFLARGGNVNFTGNAGIPGRVRLESVDLSAQSGFTGSSPAPLRIVGPGPLANPIAPTVRITSVGGSATPAVPQGGYGSVDLNLPAPGVTSVDLATTGVPSGTTVEVRVKPRFGAVPVSTLVPLSTCDAQGACTATTTFNLAAGVYTVEARATFQVQ